MGKLISDKGSLAVSITAAAIITMHALRRALHSSLRSPQVRSIDSPRSQAHAQHISTVTARRVVTLPKLPSPTVAASRRPRSGPTKPSRRGSCHALKLFPNTVVVIDTVSVAQIHVMHWNLRRFIESVRLKPALQIVKRRRCYHAAHTRSCLA